MTIKLHISPRIIPNIASLYNDTNRVFMEYIDNSIDSAEEYFNPQNNSYRKKIEICLTITNCSVVVEDNCYGITNFAKVVQEIGNSDKKAQPWTNGQFGYGIYSFMAACNKLEIISKLENEKKGKFIVIKRDQFHTDHQEDVSFPNPKLVKYNYTSGTRVILSAFDKSMWKQINFEEIKNEIEKHFELLLARKNLRISLVNDVSGDNYTCKSFNYDEFEGEEYTETLNSLRFMKGRKSPRLESITSVFPINIFLKITKGKTINKPPVFISKGRRIAEIKEIKQFKSKHKSDIWGHPNMTGYIDLSDFLEPTIARNDFKNNDNSKALFFSLEELEPLILDVIKEVNKETDDQHYRILEDKLNQALSKLARIDSMNFRTQFLQGNDVSLGKGKSGQAFEDGFGKKDRGYKKNVNGGEGWGGENEGEGKGPSGKEGNDTGGGDKDGSHTPNNLDDNLFEDSEFKGQEKKKSGFNIKIVDIDPPLNEDDKLLRSQLIGNDVRIFRRHPDFEERVQKSQKGDSKISQRLITYLAGEITVHYKDKLQTRHGQPEYNKKLFENLVEFIYQFESMLKENVGKNLSDIG